jgi:tRNA pseudouridine13 synthase
MKLKQRPDDFRVEEITSAVPSTEGSFGFYRLTKQGWTTPDAIAVVRKRWNIDLKRISFGGLKDRHAHTIQYFTIHNGPAKSFDQETLRVEYLGRVAEAYTSDHIAANGFTITLRDLSPASLAHAQEALPEVADVGVANYFDDQRFGSVGDGRSFVAKEMVLGNFEQALRLAMAVPYEHDRNEAKREKAILSEHWGDWKKCGAELPRSHDRNVLDHLVHNPTDFRGACERLRPELQGLYLAAWQSHLWNRMLSRWLSDRLPKDQLIPIGLKTGEVVMPRAIPEHVRAEWDILSIPLPSARLKLDPAAPWAKEVAAVMEEEGIPLEKMLIKDMRKPFFSKGDRIAKVPVGKPSWSAREDDHHPGQQKLELRFDLPRGCYATMVVKRLTG